MNQSSEYVPDCSALLQQADCLTLEEALDPQKIATRSADEFATGSV